MSFVGGTLAEVRTGLLQRNPSFCGKAPTWLIEIILQNLEDVIAKGQPKDSDIERFALGAIKYLAD
jgi:hypothetical protein